MIFYTWLPRNRRCKVFVHVTSILCLQIFFLFSVRAAFDPTLTILSKWGRLDDQEVSSISCMSIYSPLEAIQFDRVLNTGQESTLPSNHVITSEQEPMMRKVLNLYPSTDDKDRRFGAFSCYVVQGNITTRVVTLKQAPENLAEVIPRYAYLRTSLNSSITIQMAKKRAIPGVRLVWRHKGDRQMQSIDKLYFSLRMVKPKDGGIYELFYEQRRKFGVHGIMRLIVRDCPSGRFGYLCERTCPICINGGVCHERYGVCICPPGFAGTYCERPCGWNRFGPTCEWKCDYESEGETTGCRRSLLCLPDPYGCSCASGFWGIDCLLRCTSGRFGADCTQLCRCQNNSVCDPFTGICPHGCQEGWKGDTCQQESLGPVQNLQVSNVPSADQVKISWMEPRVSHGAALYVVTWYLVQKKACENLTEDRDTHQTTVRDKQVILRDLLPYSVYQVTVYASGPQITGEPSSISFTTGEKVPTERPLKMYVSFVGPSELDFSWNQIPCSSINGHLIAYESELSILSSETTLGPQSKYKQPLKSQRLETAVPYVKFSNLVPYQHYQFRVRGVTNFGGGPWSDPLFAFTQHSTPPTPNVRLLERTARTLTLGVNSPSLPVGVIQQVSLRGWEDHGEEAGLIVENNIDVTPKISVTFNGSAISAMHNYTFTRLQPFTLYIFQGRLLTNNGWSNWSSFFTAWTDETYPSVPVVSLLNSTSDSLLLKILRPNPPNGIILQYRLRVAGSRSPGNTPSMPVIPSPEESPVLNFTVRNLLPSTRYQVQVQASTSIGWGNWSDPLEFWTDEGAPGAPSSLVLLSCNESSLFIKWDLPKVTNGKITKYDVFYVPLSSLYPEVVIDTNATNEHYKEVNGSDNSVWIQHLLPLTSYRIHLRARTLHHVGEIIEQVFMTGLKTPFPPVCFPKRATDTAIPVRFEPIKLQSSFSSYYQIIVEDEQNNEAIDEGRLGNFTQAEEEGVRYYIALEVQAEKASEAELLLYVGDDNVYKNYWNAPLQPQNAYYFRLRIILIDGDHQENYFSVISPKSEGPLKVNAFHAARIVKPECHFYDPQCLWFPFVIVGGAIFLIWTIAAIVAYKYMAKRNTNHRVRLERGSSTSIAWSVAYRKGFGTTGSEASTLVKDQAV